MTLTVTVDGGETVQITRQVHVRNLAPDADFDWRPRPPGPGEEVRFTGLSTDADGDVVRWRWEFGGDAVSTERHPTHVFDRGGYHTVVLTVWDDWGTASTMTRKVGVCDSGSFNVDATVACTAPEG